MYEYNMSGGVGALPPRATALNVPPAMGWTGGFYIPQNEQRFSQQTCSGSAAVPMDPSSDLICGRSAELSYLNSIGCVPVGFRGSHHCLTDNDHEGVFHCCPPGVLAAAMRGDPVDDEPEGGTDPLRTGLFIGLGSLALVALGTVVYADWKEKKLARELGLEYIPSGY